MYRKKHSIVWQYFEKTTSTNAVCILCNNEYKSAKNTSNLMDHLKRKHFTVLEANRSLVEEETSQLMDSDESVTPGTLKQEVTPVVFASNANFMTQNADLPNVVQRPQIHLRQLTLRTISNELPQTKITELNNLVIAMICKDLQPFSIVEDTGFIELVKELEPRYQLPNRRTLVRTILPQVYADTKNKILQNLQQTNYVYITTDIWTNLNTQSFLTLTSHYFLQDKVYSSVLATTVLKESHTIEHITHTIQDILTEFNILDKIVAVVTDNAANMKGAVRTLGYLHLPCTAHMLNLVTKDSINGIIDITNILKTCRSLVTHFKTTVTAAEKLRNMQTQMGLQNFKLKQDVHTRWNSSLVMLERLLALKVPLSAAVVSLHRCPTILNAEQWEIIEDIIPLLKPIEYVTTELSAEKYSTASKIIPLITGIQNAIENIIPKTMPGLALKNNILNNIEIRFDYIEINKISATAAIIDPRFKTAIFQNERNSQSAIEVLKSEILLTYNDEQNNENKPTNQEEESIQDTTFWKFYLTKVSHLTKLSSTPFENATYVAQKYLDLPYENIKSDPISFWNAHGHTMPELKKISEKYLCAPATSVPSERIFSNAGQGMSERRNRLSAKNLDHIIFLNCNLE